MFSKIKIPKTHRVTNYMHFNQDRTQEHISSRSAAPERHLQPKLRGAPPPTTDMEVTHTRSWPCSSSAPAEGPKHPAHSPAKCSRPPPHSSRTPHTRCAKTPQGPQRWKLSPSPSPSPSAGGPCHRLGQVQGTVIIPGPLLLVSVYPVKAWPTHSSQAPAKDASPRLPSPPVTVGPPLLPASSLPSDSPQHSRAQAGFQVSLSRVPQDPTPVPHWPQPGTHRPPICKAPMPSLPGTAPGAPDLPEQKR